MSSRRKKTENSPSKINGASKRRKLDAESNEPVRRAGTILSMTLKNFMCHSLLEVDFSNNNICIVTGKNGSGKSAILTGLIVGLGGKATLTSRGNSVANFVKKGKLSGSVEIILYNRGSAAYEHEKFGDSIIIIRHLTSSGSSGYKIKSATGHTISTYAKVVQNITFSFNIQVNNPICLLTQDTSRNFLSSNDARNKFTLFMRASRLEELEEKLKEIYRNEEDIKDKLTLKKRNFSSLQETVRDLKRKIEGHQSIATLKENTITLKKELLWVEVNEKEKELTNEQITLDENTKKLEEFGNRQDQDKQQIATLQETMSQLKKEIDELYNEIQNQEQSQTEIKRTIENIRTTLAAKRIDRQNIQMDIKTKNTQAENLKKDIENFSKNLSEAEQNKKKRLDYLRNIQQKLKDLEENLDTFRVNLVETKNRINEKEENAGSLQSELRQTNSLINVEQRNLTSAQSQSGNSLALYGRYIPTIVSLINKRKGQFKEVPKGPLGYYIKMKNKKWALAVEGYLGPSMLSAFAVDNQKDSLVLQKIFAEVFDQNDFQPTIITSKFFYRKHDVRNNLVQAPNDCVSIYEAVEIEDPIVSNCIVDQMAIERILLVPGNDRGMELMSNRANVPKNCKQAVTINGDRFYPDPNYKTYASTYHKTRYLQTDTKQYIKFIEEKIQNLAEKEQSIKSQLADVQQDINQDKNTQRQLEIKINKINTAKIEVRKQIESTVNEANVEVQNINYFEDEFRDITNTINEKTKNAESLDENIKKIEEELKEAENVLNTQKKTTKILEEKRWNLQQRIREHTNEARDLSRLQENQKSRFRQIKETVDALKKQIESKQSEIDNMIKNASECGDRPTEFRNKLDILNEIQETKTTISYVEKEAINILEISRKYKDLLERSKITSVTIKTLQDSLEELTQAIQKRGRHYKLTERYFTTVIKYAFKKMLEYRNFKGDVEINIAQKTLDLIVKPEGKHQTSTTNLSGGEKSYATVGFLYALWHCMDFPFYFLDEFDVYMDKLNRTKVLQALIRHAKQKPELQFVFLTPQDVSFVVEDVSILKLPDPERIDQQ